MGNALGTTEETGDRKCIKHFNDSDKRRKALIEVIKSETCELPSEFKNDKEFVLDLIKLGYDQHFLRWLPKRLQEDDEILEAAIQHGLFLPSRMARKVISEETMTMLLETGRVSSSCLNFSDTMKSNKSLAIKLIEKYPDEYCSLSPEIRHDEDVSRVAIKLKGFNLYYASDAAKSDIALVKMALESCPIALGWAADECKDDYELVSHAMKKYPNVLNYASARLVNDSDLLEEALYHSRDSLSGILKKVNIDSLIRYRSYFVKLFNEKPYLIFLIDESLLKHRAIFQYIVREIPAVANYISIGNEVVVEQTLQSQDTEKESSVVKRRVKNIYQ